MARADALVLAEPVASTVAALRALHPPDDHALGPDGPDLPPLQQFAPVTPPSEPLSRAVFHDVWFRKLPKLSAADHAGWRYESTFPRPTDFFLPLVPMPLPAPPLPLSLDAAPMPSLTSPPSSLMATSLNPSDPGSLVAV